MNMFTYAENHSAGHHSKHRRQPESLSTILARQTPPVAQPLAWDDIANWRGKNVWGVFDGVRQQLHIMSLAPEGNEGERWYVMPFGGVRLNIGSISKTRLELTKPVTCTDLMIVPQIKTRLTGRALSVPEIIYL